MNLGQALRSPEFWLLFVAAFAAAAGLSGWIIVPLTLAGLSISSLPKYFELWPRARNVGAEGEWWRTLALSALNSFAASCAAFLLGRGIGWLYS